MCMLPYLQSSTPLVTMLGHNDAVLCMAHMSVDGQLELVSGSADWTARVWGAAGSMYGVCKAHLLGHGAAVTSVYIDQVS